MVAASKNKRGRPKLIDDRFIRQQVNFVSPEIKTAGGRQAITQIQASITVAVQTLNEIMGNHNAPASSRVSAVKP